MSGVVPPHPDPLPQHKSLLGEREQIVETLTQGGARSSCSRLPCATTLTPLQGSQAEAAASLPLHFLKKVQSPAPFERWPGEAAPETWTSWMVAR
jgi:hypothetical protein